MVAYFNDACHDTFLQYIKTNGDRFTICNAQPTTYAQANNSPGASGYRLGYKNSITYTGPQDRTTVGRELVVDAISGGTVDYTGTASHWAIIKTSATTALLATHTLASSQAVTSGNTFSTTAFDLYVLDPT